LRALQFLFATLQFDESDFYGRVGRELRRLGHSVAHVTYSRRAARKLARAGPAYCLPDEMRDVDAGVSAREVARRYGLSSLHDVYRTDIACRGHDEEWCVERTRRHYLALERVFDAVRPDIVVPEVGTESMRTAAHHIGQARGARVWFLFFTIFPRPLRLYEDTMHAPIVPAGEVRELSDGERAEVQRFAAEFTAA
jgi:hypothetical protein